MTKELLSAHNNHRYGFLRRRFLCRRFRHHHFSCRRVVVVGLSVSKLAPPLTDM